MGMTDVFIIPRYAKLVGDYINKNLLPGSKIAWLGQQPPGSYSDMFDAINDRIFVEGIEHHFHDIRACRVSPGRIDAWWSHAGSPPPWHVVQWDVHTHGMMS